MTSRNSTDGRKIDAIAGPIWSQKIVEGRQSHAVTLVLICFSVGVVAIRLLPDLPDARLFSILSLVFLGVAGRRPHLLWFTALVVGFCWAGWSAATIAQSELPVEMQRKDLQVVGRIASPVTTTGYGTRFDFAIDAMSYRGKALARPDLIRLTSYQNDLPFEPGQRWRFIVRLKRPHGLVNPGMGFDYEAWLFQQNIRATGYVVKDSAQQLSARPRLRDRISANLASVRRGYAEFLGEVVEDPARRSILAALGVGLRNQMDTDTWKRLQNTGTAHLVAISGLHIGLVAMLAGWLGSAIWGRFAILCRVLPRQRSGLIAGMIVGTAYAALAGFPLPARRAAVMLLVVALTLLSNRRMMPGQLIALVLVAVLLFDPLAPLSSSFWLSFTAVAVLVFALIKNGNGGDLGLVTRIYRWGRRWSLLQIFLFLGMMPILLISFQKISLVAPLANLFSIPLIGMLVVPLGLISLCAWSLGANAIAQLTVALADWLLAFCWQLLAHLEAMPYSIWQQGQPSLTSAALAAVGILLVLRGSTVPGRWLGIIWMLPMMMTHKHSLQPGEFRFTALDVGQGLAQVIQTRNHTLVFDVGAAYPSGFNLAAAVVVPYLRSQGVSTIDRLVLSHGDNDHSGGANTVISEFQVEQLVVTDLENAPSVDHRMACEAGQRWQWDQVRFSVFWPLPNRPYRGNESSCVILVQSQHGSVLLSGDIEAGSEKTLLQNHKEQLKVDVLQVPHHGSNTSSIPKFIDAARPTWAVVSAGNLNRFGHPDARVVGRYRNAQIPLLTTANQGAIEFEFSSDGITTRLTRKAAPRFWRAKPIERNSDYRP